MEHCLLAIPEFSVLAPGCLTVTSGCSKANVSPRHGPSRAFCPRYWGQPNHRIADATTIQPGVLAPGFGVHGEFLVFDP